MSVEQLNELESYISSKKEIVSFADTLDRLRKNPDFIKIIEEGYFKEEAIRLVAFTGSHAYTGQTKIDTDAEIQAIGKLRHYFYSINRNGNKALAEIDEAREAVVEIEAQLSEEENE
jgi:hypothetical protein